PLIGVELVPVLPENQPPPVTVGERAGENPDHIDDLADAEESPGEQPENSRADLPDINALDSADSAKRQAAERQRPEPLEWRNSSGRIRQRRRCCAGRIE